MKYLKNVLSGERGQTARISLGLLALYGAAGSLYLFHDLSLSELRKEFIPGIHGVEMMGSEDATFSFDPWETLERNATLPIMLRDLCTKAEKPSNCFERTGAKFRVYRKEHIVQNSSLGSSTRQVLERNTEALDYKNVTPALIDERISYARDWILANQSTDGAFPYSYFPSSKIGQNNTNIIHHIIMVEALYSLAREKSDKELLEKAQTAEKHLLKNALSETATTAHVIDFDGRAPLGATALALVMMSAEPELHSPAKIQKMSAYLLSAQRPDGTFLPYPKSASASESSDDPIFSGEALAALAAVGSENPKIVEALDLSLVHYKELLEHDFRPQSAPWLIRAYAKAFLVTGNEKYAEFVLWLADGIVDTMLKHDTYALPDEESRFYNPEYPSWGAPHSASAGNYLESLALAHEIARSRHDSEQMTLLRDAIVRATRSLLLLQFTPVSAYYIKEPTLAIGAFKVSITDNRLRIDQTGFAILALLHARNALMD